jgi:probable HAF family extracellular repeat protein
MTDLGNLGGSYSQSQANGIEDNVQMVGYSITASGEAAHAFLYSNGSITDLGTLNGQL